MSVPSLLSVDEIVNYGIGAGLLDDFMTRDKVAIKKNGNHYYLYETGNSITQEMWSEITDDGYKYINSNSVYQDKSTWGSSVEMIKESSTSDTATHNLGTLTYSVPDSSSAYDTDNYVLSGNSIEDDKGITRNVKLYVDNTGGLDVITTSQSYQELADVSLFEGQEYNLAASGTKSASYSSTISRTFGLMAKISYKLEATVGTDTGVDDSVSQSLKASLELEFSETSDQTTAGDDTIDVSAESAVTNTSDQTLRLLVVTPTYHSSSQYEINGTLASVQGVDPSNDFNIVQYYDQKDGQKPYKYRPLFDVESVLKSAKTGLLDAASTDDNYSESDQTLADNIDPKSGYISTTGSFTSYAPNTTTVEMWVYNDIDNCYANSFDNATDDECNCNKNEDAYDSGLTVNEEATCTPPSSPRSARSQEPRFDSEVFTLSRLKNMHKIEPQPHDTVSLEIDGESVDFSVGSMAQTFNLAFAIGGNARDWHTNKVKGEHGGSILHKGSDHYFGNTGQDFVSSKSVGGASSIRTKGGDDTVLIDVKKFKKFTPGRTYLGKGHDTYLYLGSKKDLDEMDSRHENLLTGKGKDTIIVKNNAKLHVEDFNLNKDTLQMNFDEYESTIIDHTIILTSDEGGSVILRDALKGFTGNYDSLPFA